MKTNLETKINPYESPKSEIVKTPIEDKPFSYNHPNLYKSLVYGTFAIGSFPITYILINPDAKEKIFEFISKLL